MKQQQKKPKIGKAATQHQVPTQKQKVTVIHHFQFSVAPTPSAGKVAPPAKALISAFTVYCLRPLG